MALTVPRRLNHALFNSAVAFFCGAARCFAAVQKEVESRPDGTVITHETTRYYPPLSIVESIIIGIVALFGGVIALLGIRLILRALQFGRDAGSAEIAIDVKAKTLKMKRLTQGALVTTIGAAIMLGALYFLKN